MRHVEERLGQDMIGGEFRQAMLMLTLADGAMKPVTDVNGFWLVIENVADDVAVDDFTKTTMMVIIL